MSVATLYKHREIISGALKQAVRNKIIPHNVMEDVRLPRQTEPEKEILTVEEQKRLEKVALDSHTMWAFSIVLALYTGMRQGELIALKISDIDLKKRRYTSRAPLVVSPYQGSEERRGEILRNPKPQRAKGRYRFPIFWQT